MPINWGDQATAISFEQTAQNLININDSDVVLKFWLGVQKVLRNAANLNISSDVMPYYERAVGYAGMARLPLMSEHDALELFANHLPLLLDYTGEELHDQFWHLLITMGSLDDRDDFKGKLREQLLRSAQKITQSVAGVPDGTAAAWLAHVMKSTNGEIASSLKIADFFTVNSVVKTLSNEESSRLRKLVNIFVQTSISSAADEGMEDELVADDDVANEVTFYDQKGVRTIKKNEDPLFAQRVPQMMKALQQSWFFQAQERTPLEVEADAYAKESGMTEVKAQEILSAPRINTDKKTVVAALRMFASGKTMAELVSLLAHQVSVTATPEAVVKVLHTALVDELKLPDVHAAAIVWRIIAELQLSDQEHYADLVYYDMGSGYFAWNEAYMVRSISEI